MGPGELDQFVDSILSKLEILEGPKILLDVPDDAGVSGWHSGTTGDLHFHPELLRPMTVLHEMAHWLTPGHGHGSWFVENFSELVAIIYGDEIKEEFRAYMPD